MGTNPLVSEARGGNYWFVGSPASRTGQYRPRFSRDHQLPSLRCCAEFVNRYRYITARMKRGGRLGNGFSFSRERTEGDACCKVFRKRRNQGLPSAKPSAANHICQSSRG